MRKLLTALFFCLIACAAQAQVIVQWGQDASGTNRNVYVLDPTDKAWIAIGAFNISTDVWTPVGGGGGGSGTVTSVVLTAPAIFTATGCGTSTTSWSCMLTLASETANTFFAAPNGSSGTPTFRAVLIADISNLGSNVATALAAAANANNGFPDVDGAITTGDCLKWGPGIQDAGAACGSGGGAGTVTSITPGAGLSVAPTSTSLTPITSSGTLYDDASYHANFLGGLTTSNDGTTPNSVLDIAAGNANDSTNVVNIKIGAFTKSTAGAWAAGSGSNGMGNGLTVAASTWYYDCLAYNGGTPDIWFDTSVTCANKPTGISGSLYRRIGEFKTDGSSHILAFVQNANTFLWAVPVNDVVSGTAPTTATAVALASVPTGLTVNAMINGSYINSAAGVKLLIYSGLLTTAQTAANGNTTAQSSTSGNGQSFWQEVLTDTSQHVFVASTATGGTYVVWTQGWIDPTLGSPGGGGTGGSGTVTSVAQSFTGGLISVAGSPVTSSGTLALTVAGTSGGIPYFSSASTWASSAALASTDIVLGGGAGNAPATDANASLTAGALTLGASGTAGSVKLGNATSGTVVLQPVTGALGSVTASLPANTGTIAELNLAQTFSGAQTFGEVIGTVTTQSGTTYTFAATDCGTEVTFSNASAVTATIPQTLPAGCNIAVAQLGAGKVSVNGSAVTPATLHSAHSYTGTFAQWSLIGINIESNSGGSSAVAIFTGDGS